MINYGERCMIDFTNRRPILKKERKCGAVSCDGEMMVAIERQNLLQIAEDKNFLNSDADLDSFIDGLETALIISMLVEDDTNEFMHPGETPQGIRKFTLGGE